MARGGRSRPSFLRLEGRLAENPAGRRLRPTRAKILTPPPGTAGTLAVFGGPSKSGRYVYGFCRPKKERPVRLRFSVAQKETANMFTVFKTMPTSKRNKGGCSWLTFLRLEGRLAENPAGRRLLPTRAKILTPPPGTAGTLAFFGGPSKSGQYVYGFWRPKKERPVRLRFSVAQKKTSNTFMVFKTMPTYIL